MSFLDLLALRKAKLGGKFQAPEKQCHEVAGELDKEEVIEEVRNEVRGEERWKQGKEPLNCQEIGIY